MPLASTNRAVREPVAERLARRVTAGHYGKAQSSVLRVVSRCA